MAGERELGGVLDGNNSLAGRDFLGKNVEQRRFPRPGSTRHQQIAPGLHRLAEQRRPLLSYSPGSDQGVESGNRLGEPSHRHGRSVDRHRGYHRVKT